MGGGSMEAFLLGEEITHSFGHHSLLYIPADTYG